MAMGLHLHGKQLAHQLVERSIIDLERQARHGHYNWGCITAVAVTAQLLDAESFVTRAWQLLQDAPADSFWSGAITNLDRSHTLPESMRALPPLSESEELHPLYQEAQILDMVQQATQSERHLALCLERRYDDAYACATSELAIEEIARTQALLGDFVAAIRCIRDHVVPTYRQQGARVVLAIELFRHGQIEQARGVLTDLEASDLDPWERIHVALGIAGRIPWRGYPYPDW